MTAAPPKARGRARNRRSTKVPKSFSVRCLRSRCLHRRWPGRKGVSCIAFSTDSSVAGRGVYLLSFLPESDVNRIVEYASVGKKSFAALLPDNAYGNVVEATFKQAVPAAAAASSRSRIRRTTAQAGRRPWRRRSARPTRCSSPTTAMRWRTRTR